MIRMIYLKEYKNKMGLEGYEEAIEKKELQRIIDLIRLDFSEINAEVLELVEMSADFIIQQVIDSLHNNVKKRRPLITLNMNIIFRVMKGIYKSYLKKYTKENNENLFKIYMVVSLTYLTNWLHPLGVLIEITETTIIFDVEHFNYLYSKKSIRFE